MTILHIANTWIFEQWLLQTYPGLFSEWELEACEWLDLDEWLDKEHYRVLDEWQKFRFANPAWHPKECQTT